MPTAKVNVTQIAKSDETVFLEGDHRGMLKKVNPKESQKIYECPQKNHADYQHLSMGAEFVNERAWMYPDPTEKAQEIKGHYAFDKETVDLQ